MKISVIIPNYNGESLLKKNLPKIVKAAEFYTKKVDRTIEIIIIDDHSKDNSVLVVNEFKERKNTEVSIKLVEKSQNEGFASSVNNGANVASGEIFVLLNTDVYPDDGKTFFERIEKVFSTTDLSAIGFMDKSIEGDKTILRGRGLGEWKRGFLVHRKGDVTYANTLWVSGGSSAFTAKAWSSAGGLLKVYDPFYWEDIDLSYRIIKAGHRIEFRSEIVVVHEHEKGAIKSSYTQSQIKKVVYRNQFFFAWLNLTDPKLIFIHLIFLPYHLVNSTFSGEIALVSGFIRAAFLLPKILRQRRKNKKLFVLTDREVIEKSCS